MLPSSKHQVPDTLQLKGNAAHLKREQPPQSAGAGIATHIVTQFVNTTIPEHGAAIRLRSAEHHEFAPPTKLRDCWQKLTNSANTRSIDLLSCEQLKTENINHFQAQSERFAAATSCNRFCHHPHIANS